MANLSVLKLFESLSLCNPSIKIAEEKDFLQFGKLVFTASGRINFVDTDYLLKELKLDITQLLPFNESVKGFYSVEEILTSCKKTDLQHLLNMCIKDSLDYIIMVLKGCYFHDLKDLSSFTKDIIQFTEVFESEKAYFCNDFSVHVVDFLESLLNLLDANYASGLTREKAEINAFIICTIVGSMKYYKVRQRIILRTIVKMPLFIAYTEAYVDHREDFNSIEQMTTYLLLGKEALQESVKLHNKVFESSMELCSRQQINVFVEFLTKIINSSCIYLSHLAKTCFKQVKTYEGLLENKS